MNLIRYIIPLEVKSILMRGFYAFATILTLARIAELIIISIPTSEGCIDYNNSKNVGQVTTDMLANCSNVAICCLFMGTMFEIAISIQMMEGLLEV